MLHMVYDAAVAGGVAAVKQQAALLWLGVLQISHMVAAAQQDDDDEIALGGEFVDA